MWDVWPAWTWIVSYVPVGALLQRLFTVPSECACHCTTDILTVAVSIGLGASVTALAFVLRRQPAVQVIGLTPA